MLSFPYVAHASFIIVSVSYVIVDSRWWRTRRAHIHHVGIIRETATGKRHPVPRPAGIPPIGTAGRITLPPRILTPRFLRRTGVIRIEHLSLRGVTPNATSAATSIESARFYEIVIIDVKLPIDIRLTFRRIIVAVVSRRSHIAFMIADGSAISIVADVTSEMRAPFSIVLVVSGVLRDPTGKRGKHLLYFIALN